jgi:hypothetical protein
VKKIITVCLICQHRTLQIEDRFDFRTAPPKPHKLGGLARECLGCGSIFDRKGKLIWKSSR